MALKKIQSGMEESDILEPTPESWGHLPSQSGTTLSKRAVFRAIASNLGVPVRSISDRYFRDKMIMNRNHPDGESLVRDNQTMAVLNRPFNASNRKSGKPELSTEELIASLEGRTFLKQEIQKILQPKESNPSQLKYLVKQSLFAVANGNTALALQSLVKALELVDGS